MSQRFTVENLHTVLTGADNDHHDGIEGTPGLGQLIDVTEHSGTFIADIEPGEGGEPTYFRVTIERLAGDPAVITTGRYAP